MSLRLTVKLLWLRFWYGPVELLSDRTVATLDGVLTTRDGFNGDLDNFPVPGAPPQPDPLPAQHNWGRADRVGPYAVSVSYQLKAEGLGSAGLDSPDNRRIATLRASDIMRKHGIRPSHIAKSVPMAVALAFIPLPEEVAARQLEFVLTASDAKEAATRKWVDPRALGGVEPTRAYN